MTLTNSNSTVARLRSDEPAATGGQTGQVVKKTINAGTYYTHAITTGTTYGFAFEPMGTGTTTVTVTAPGALTMTTTGVRQVQVTSPVITAGGTVTVGAGLMDSALASLSAAQHGGVDVTITAGTASAARAGAPLAHRDRGRDAIDHRPSEQRPDLDPVLRARVGEHHRVLDDHADGGAVYERLAHGRCRAARRRDSST